MNQREIGKRSEYVGVSARRARLVRLREEAEAQVASGQQACMQAQERYDSASDLLVLLRRQRDELPSSTREQAQKLLEQISIAQVYQLPDITLNIRLIIIGIRQPWPLILIVNPW